MTDGYPAITAETPGQRKARPHLTNTLGEVARRGPALRHTSNCAATVALAQPTFTVQNVRRLR
jgi:hypothetical protein